MRIYDMLQTEEPMQRPHSKDQHQVKELRAKVDYKGGEQREMTSQPDTSHTSVARASVRVWAFILRTEEGLKDFKARQDLICTVKGSFSVENA